MRYALCLPINKRRGKVSVGFVLANYLTSAAHHCTLSELHLSIWCSWDETYSLSDEHSGWVDFHLHCTLNMQKQSEKVVSYSFNCNDLHHHRLLPQYRFGREIALLRWYLLISTSTAMNWQYHHDEFNLSSKDLTTVPVTPSYNNIITCLPLQYWLLSVVRQK